MKCLRAGFLAALLVPCALGATVAFSERPADASVVVAITFESLLRQSSAASVATAVEQKGVWENGRIYTYSRVHVERGVAGGLGQDSEVWVRTMGGVVGNIGQSVEGEAVLTVGRPSLVFLHERTPGTMEVTARAQGQFPVVVGPDKSLRIGKNHAIGVTLPARVPSAIDPQTTSKSTAATSPATAPGTTPATVPAAKLGPLGARGTAVAAELLLDRPLDDVAKEVAEAWGRVHTP